MPNRSYRLIFRFSTRVCLVATLAMPLLGRADPTSEEQYWLEILNHARSDPAGELGRLVNYDTPATFGSPASNDSDIAAALNYFGVSASDLAAQWSTLIVAPPLAWNDSLATSALSYSQLMVSLDQQAHGLDGQTIEQRVGAYSTNYLDVGENLYVAGTSVAQAHAAFLIDWGDSDSNPNNGFGDGIQAGALHRDVSFAPVLKEIGIGIAKTIPAQNVLAVGPYVVTQHLGSQFRKVGGKFVSDAILTGVVYNDNVLANHFYTPGEGIEGAAVQVFDDATNDLLFAGATNAAGGFNIALPGVTDGEVLRIEVPGFGVQRETAEVTSFASDPSLHNGVPVTYFNNIYAGFVVPEPGGAALLALAGLIFGCRRRRFCFDKGAGLRRG